MRTWKSSGPSMLGIDIRCLQDRAARGVYAYADRLIRGIIAQTDVHLLASGRRPAPDLTGVFKHVRVPNRLLGTSMQLLGIPTLDKILTADSVWMPNLDTWAVGSKAKLTVTFHDLSFLVEPTWFTLKERAKHAFLEVRRLSKRADAIITLSSHTKHELVERLHVPEEKIKVITPGIPELLPAPERPFPWQYVLTHCVLERRKNIVAAIRAFDRLAEDHPELRYVLSGAFGTGADEIRRAHESAKHRKRIIFTGRVDEQTKAALFRHASVFFFPSLYEGFGFPPLEAMAAGVPVVASTGGALPETLSEAALLVGPWDTGALANALHQVLTDARLATSLRLRGSERVKLFSWEEAVKNTLSIL